MTNKLLAAFLILLGCCTVILGQQLLLVVGGGTRPPDSVKKFVEWSGGAKSRLLVITWASGVPDESFEALRKIFAEANAGAIEHAAIRPLDADKRAKFVF